MNNNIFMQSESSRKSSANLDCWDDYMYKYKVKSSGLKCLIPQSQPKMKLSPLKFSFSSADDSKTLCGSFEFKAFDDVPEPSNVKISFIDFLGASNIPEEGEVSTNENTPNKPDQDVQDFSSLINAADSSCGNNKTTETEKGKNVQIRWKKKDDSILYNTLISDLEKSSMTFEDLTSTVFKEYNPSFLTELVEKIGWRGSCETIKKRIIKLMDASKKLSSRELKQLRKIYYIMIRANKLDWKELQFNFPAKDISFLKDTCFAFPRGDKISRLAQRPYYNDEQSNQI